MASTTQNSILFIAGDPSGDEHASHIISRLKNERPDIQCFGIGGALMQQYGFKPLMPFAPFNRMGLGDVLANLIFFIKAKRFLASYMKRHRPLLLVLVDYAGFNIRMLKIAHRLGIKTVWYIAPKVWAWKKKRASVLGRYADTIATILPFECQWYKGFNARVIYAGNPCVESLMKNQRLYAQNKKTGRFASVDSAWRVAILPGSRAEEIERIFPSIAQAACILDEKYSTILNLSIHPALDRNLYLPYMNKCKFFENRGNIQGMLAWADIAIVTSGTATLQAALMGVPHVLVYKMSIINELAFNLFVRSPYLGLPNIIAGREIVKECIQEKSEPESLTREMSKLMDDKNYYNQTCRELANLRNILGVKKPSEEVSGLILNKIQEIESSRKGTHNPHSNKINTHPFPFKQRICS